MPTRCKWYEVDGTPKRGGCCYRPLGQCRFIHPDEPAWKTASAPGQLGPFTGPPSVSAYSSGMGFRKRREPDTGFGNDNNSTSTSVASTSTWGAPATARAESWATSADQRSSDAIGSAVWNTSPSTDTSKDKEKSSHGGSQWGTSGPSWSTGGWGAPASTSGNGGWGDPWPASSSVTRKQDANNPSDSKADWGAPTWASNGGGWGGSGAAWDPPSEKSTGWGDQPSIGSSGGWGVASVTDDATMIDDWTSATAKTKSSTSDIAGVHQVQEEVSDPYMPIDESANDPIPSTSAPALSAQQVDLPLPHRPLSPLADFNTAIPTPAHPRTASSPIPVDAGSSWRLTRRDMPSRHRQSSSPSCSPVREHPFDYSDLIGAFSKAVTSQIEFDELEASHSRSRAFQLSKSATKSGPRGLEKLKSAYYEESIAVRSAQRKKDAAIRHVKTVAEWYQDAASVASLGSGTLPSRYTTSMEKTVKDLQAQIYEIKVFLAEVSTCTSENHADPSQSVLSGGERWTVPKLARRIRKADNKIADLEDYLDELRDNGRHCLEDRLQQVPWSSYGFVPDQVPISDEERKTHDWCKKKVTSMSSDLESIHKNLDKLQARLADRQAEQTVLHEEQRILHLKAKKLEADHDVNGQNYRDFAVQLGDVRAQLDGLRQHHQREVSASGHLLAGLIAQLGPPLALAARQDTMDALEVIASGFRESLAAYQKTVSDAVWQHLEPILAVQGSIQDMLDERVVVAKLLSGSSSVSENDTSCTGDETV